MGMRAFGLLFCTLFTSLSFPQTRPEEVFLLAEPETFSKQHSELLNEAIRFIVELGYEANEFQVTINECNAEWCQVFLSPVNVNLDDEPSIRAICPQKYCASLRYVFRSSSFGRVVRLG